MKSLGPHLKKKGKRKVIQKNKRNEKKNEKRKKNGANKVVRSEEMFWVYGKSLVDFKEKELMFLRFFGERCELGLTLGNDCVTCMFGKMVEQWRLSIVCMSWSFS